VTAEPLSREERDYIIGKTRRGMWWQEFSRYEATVERLEAENENLRHELRRYQRELEDKPRYVEVDVRGPINDGPLVEEEPRKRPFIEEEGW